jgi:hypothetical protein
VVFPLLLRAGTRHARAAFLIDGHQKAQAPAYAYMRVKSSLTLLISPIAATPGGRESLGK